MPESYSARIPIGSIVGYTKPEKVEPRLRESIIHHGLMHPLLVRKISDGYEIITGHEYVAVIFDLLLHDVPDCRNFMTGSVAPASQVYSNVAATIVICSDGELAEMKRSLGIMRNDREGN